MVMLMGSLVVIETFILMAIFVLFSYIEITRNVPKDDRGKRNFGDTPGYSKATIMLSLIGFLIELTKCFYTIKYILTH